MNFTKKLICPILHLTGFLFSFDGRIGRKMYWFLNLIILPIYAIIFRLMAGFLDTLTNLINPHIIESKFYIAANILNVSVSHFHFFLITWITCSIQLKRYHDLNKSGWWQLILIILAFKTLIAGGQLNKVPMIVISALIFLGLQVEMGTFKGSDGIDYGARNTFKDVIKDEGLANIEKLTGIKLLKLFFLMLFIYFGAQFFKAFLRISLAG